ncbi:hypothetical protein B296_00015334 [Ensete ventricosum]|uniref:Uncharacterized protein n=1 Tax=Ensete ventricosum TaxID=4639 RepID=A0A427A0T9_ENSVE|nr:hypothetical protein B296_00015334 [Ensete ventricosum]
MQLGAHLECVGSLPRVSGAYQDRKGVHRKKSKTRRKIVRDSRKAYRELERFALPQHTAVLDSLSLVPFLYLLVSSYLHPKKIDSGYRWAWKKRTQGVDVG